MLVSFFTLLFTILSIREGLSAPVGPRPGLGPSSSSWNFLHRTRSRTNQHTENPPPPPPHPPQQSADHDNLSGRWTILDLRIQDLERNRLSDFHELQVLSERISTLEAKRPSLPRQGSTASIVRQPRVQKSQSSMREAGRASPLPLPSPHRLITDKSPEREVPSPFFRDWAPDGFPGS